ncbi:MAG TPA: undecaprenyldiphospho-muramoylpentapeptide beta-N-acetylglucosaminyltransferase [Acidimicrobiales bacterium]|jgi:undecaprenyldiphospho-muramoylpentapeptide beta-N-acetylglucosaminyltransferase|nr:undecaprenyldiphospho-muramoylpentapeptide beta-N-acetylglucosaminyltransferase [Acidimicrobiales bacterium]HJM28099.1 undecaprenyldiphospho-muramoylpentapeptide beta-N-acetylglucosaminyltransferase [Acidimicrobiales bacterium]HJM96638.1 undecaprenyldiphospho-muramoylpentapeptide beta-N-acetylglucosaminyltransferase [Acidimicrobiales bacterium]
MKECFVIIAGGGTAGHLHPGLAVAESLVTQGIGKEEIIFIGSDREIDRKLVPAAGFEMIPLTGAGLQKKTLVAILKTLILLISATWKALKICNSLNPKIILALGGYASLPGALAGLFARVPVILHEQNAVPGRANWVISKWARKSAISYPKTALRNRIFTGNPVRSDILALQPGTKASDRQKLGVPNENLFIVVTGGSLGALRINSAVINAIHELGKIGNLTIYHIIGERDWKKVVIPDHVDGIDYQPVEYENNMPSVLNAADLIVSRAGGSITAEIAVLGIPAILIPLPNAPGDHQTKNAQALVEVGAAVIMKDEKCSGANLVEEIKGIIESPGLLETMSLKCNEVGNRDASTLLARTLLEEAL